MSYPCNTHLTGFLWSKWHRKCYCVVWRTSVSFLHCTLDYARLVKSKYLMFTFWSRFLDCFLFFEFCWFCEPICLFQYSVWRFYGIKQHIGLSYKYTLGNCSVAKHRFAIYGRKKISNVFLRIQTDFRQFQSYSFDLIYCSILIIFAVNIPCGYTKKISMANSLKNNWIFFQEDFPGKIFIFNKIGY